MAAFCRKLSEQPPKKVLRGNPDSRSKGTAGEVIGLGQVVAGERDKFVDVDS